MDVVNSKLIFDSIGADDEILNENGLLAIIVLLDLIESIINDAGIYSCI